MNTFVLCIRGGKATESSRMARMVEIETGGVGLLLCAVQHFYPHRAKGVIDDEIKQLSLRIAEFFPKKSAYESLSIISLVSSRISSKFSLVNE